MHIPVRRIMQFTLQRRIRHLIILIIIIIMLQHLRVFSDISEVLMFLHLSHGRLQLQKMQIHSLAIPDSLQLLTCCLLILRILHGLNIKRVYKLVISIKIIREIQEVQLLQEVLPVQVHMNSQ